MYIYGKNVVCEYLNHDDKIKKIYMYKNFKDQNIINKLKEKNIKINYMEKYELDDIAKNNQGIILEVENYKYHDLNSILNDNFIVMLDHIEDPHNFGAIIRTCEAAKVDSIIIPQDRSCEVNSTVIKVSTGSIKNIKITRVVNLNQTIDKLKENGFWIIGTDMEGTDYRKIDYNGKTCIVIGNEGKGISTLTRKKCDFIASIPMYGSVNSLNASVSTGIILFKAVDKRNGL